jgi:hypothetical protein
MREDFLHGDPGAGRFAEVDLATCLVCSTPSNSLVREEILARLSGNKSGMI